MTATPRTTVELRRALHSHPEVGLDLPVTQRMLLEELRAAGIECHLGSGLSSVTAIVRGDQARNDSAVVLVRSDMDALPVAESTGLSYAAVNGAMHACGHDLHMAIVLAAALETQRRRDELAGVAVFVFQPGEEGHGGAQMMLDEGVLDLGGARPAAALGLHVLAHHLPAGVIATRPGAVLGGSTLVDIEVTGRGGHGSAPHLARSPLVAASELVMSSLAAVASRVSAFDTAVLSYGALQAGTVRNIIPNRAMLAGVIRFFDADVGQQVLELVRSTADAIATAHSVTIDVRARLDTVPTMTDPGELEFLHEIAPGRVAELERPLAISEDFSWFLRQIPGVFLLVGACIGDPATAPSNHSADAQFAESVMSPVTDLVVDWVFARVADRP